MIELKRLEGTKWLKVTKRVGKVIGLQDVLMHALRIVNQVSKMIRL
jgi:hypothetical protein